MILFPRRKQLGILCTRTFIFWFSLLILLPATLAASRDHQTARLRERLHFEPFAERGGSEGYRAQSPGYMVELTMNGVRLWTAIDNAKSVEIRFEGASGPRQVRVEDPLPGVVNRYLGNDPSQWRSGIATFGRVRLEQVYPGIDVVFYGNGLELEYDIEVSPGAATDDVRIDFQGTDGVELDGDGALLLKVGKGTLRQRTPLVYQLQNGSRVTVPSGYRLDETGRARFEIGAYNRDQALIIDPVMEWSTYFGGTSEYELISDVTVDGAGNIYVTGRTYMTGAGDIPLEKAFQDHDDFRDQNENVVASFNAFVASFTPEGKLRFSTYLGGRQNDAGVAIAAGPGLSDGVFVTGWTQSIQPHIVTTFPLTRGAYLTNKTVVQANGIFLTKFATSGQILYSTLLFPDNQGGTGYAVGVDKEGRAYVGGSVDLGRFPGNIVSGFGDAFLIGVNAAGSGLIYTNLVGSQGRTVAVVVETNGIAHIGGAANAFQSTPNAFDSAAPAGLSLAGFYQKVAPNGAVLYATRFTPVGDAAIAADGNILLVGGIGDTSGQQIVTNGFQMTFGGGSADGFIAKFDPSKSGREALVMASFFGGNGNEVISQIAVDNDGNIAIAGSTDSTDLRMVDATQTNHAGGTDVFVAQLNATASGIIFSTYLGGTKDEPADGAAHLLSRTFGLAFDPWGRFFVVGGGTTSTDFPLAKALQNSIKGANSGFISKFSTGVAQRTFIVNSENDVDDGACDTAHCSLREAIHAANETPGHQTIIFDIPSNPPYTIQPLGRLPIISEPVTIDGFTHQRTWKVQIDGSSAGAVEGFQIVSGGSTLRGLLIRRFSRGGIILRDQGGNIVTDCVIGLDRSMTADEHNRGEGILIEESSNNVIGDFGAANVICANWGDGIRIQGVRSTGNQIGENYIGVTPEGRVFGNTQDGIAIYEGSRNEIGGGSLGNVIGGNEYNGIYIERSLDGHNLVRHNYIGVTPDKKPTPNKRNGIEIRASSFNTIGGGGLLDGNVISANLLRGIVITNPVSFGNKIQGNYIGVVPGSDTPFGNGGDGILLFNTTHTEIGGFSTDYGLPPGNIISGNGLDGIAMDRSSSDTVIEGNIIGADFATGAKRIGNRFGIFSGDSRTKIGGPKSGQGNLIAGNREGGIRFGGPGVVVQGNKIGVDLAGNANLNNDDSTLGSPQEIYVGKVDSAVIGGQRLPGFMPGEPPGNVIGDSIQVADGSYVEIRGNSIGTDPGATKRLGRGRIVAKGHHVNVIGGNQIAGGVELEGLHNTVRGNIIGIDRNDPEFSNVLPMVDLGDSVSSAVGGRQPGDPNIIFGGSHGIALDLPSSTRSDNELLGNTIRGFSESAISTNSAAADRVARPKIEQVDQFHSGSSVSLVNVSFEPLADHEAGEIEVFRALPNSKGEAEPYELLARALIPRDGTRTNVLVRVSNVFFFDQVTASVTKYGRTTSQFALPVEPGIDTPPDADGDGISDETEKFGGNIDGNKDGTPDSQQREVLFLPGGYKDNWMSIRMISDAQLVYVEPKNDLPPPNIPNTPFEISLGWNYSFNFRVSEFGGAVTLEAYFPPDLKVDAMLMYGKTALNPDAHWELFAYDGVTGAEFTDDKATIHLVDGGRGDDDLQANGNLYFNGTVVWTPDGPAFTPRITDFELGTDIFLDFEAPANVPFQVQESADLINWQTVWSPVFPSPEPTAFLPSPVLPSTNGISGRFFRLQSAPPPPP